MRVSENALVCVSVFEFFGVCVSDNALVCAGVFVGVLGCVCDIMLCCTDRCVCVWRWEEGG